MKSVIKVAVLLLSLACSLPAIGSTGVLPLISGNFAASNTDKSGSSLLNAGQYLEAGTPDVTGFSTSILADGDLFTTSDSTNFLIANVEIQDRPTYTFSFTTTSELEISTGQIDYAQFASSGNFASSGEFDLAWTLEIFHGGASLGALTGSGKNIINGTDSQGTIKTVTLSGSPVSLPGAGTYSVELSAYAAGQRARAHAIAEFRLGEVTLPEQFPETAPHIQLASNGEAGEILASWNTPDGGWTPQESADLQEWDDISLNALSTGENTRTYAMNTAAGQGFVRLNSKPQPNIVVILIDDMGYTDIEKSPYWPEGSTWYETPNITTLSESGITFSHGYAASPVCSPTRAALLTGKYPARTNFTQHAHGGTEGVVTINQLPSEELTLAEALKTAGYVTAFFGKWHVGRESNDSGDPTQHGFDLNIGGGEAGQPLSFFADETGAFYNGRPGQTDWILPNLGPGSSEPGEELTQRLTRAASDWIAQVAGQEEPFLVYLSHYAVHRPTQARQELVDKYNTKPQTDPRHKKAAYAGMVEEVDHSVGAIMAALADPNNDGDPSDSVLENTLVIFTSDNGGVEADSDQDPLRAGKSWEYEGGTRVPLIITGGEDLGLRQGQVDETVATTVDLFATILDLAGYNALPENTDGLSLAPRLRDPDSAWTRQAIFSHYPHSQGGEQHSWVREGEVKLIRYYSGDFSTVDGEMVELFDLSADPSETTDLSQQQSAEAGRLLDILESWMTEVDAKLPPN